MVEKEYLFDRCLRDVFVDGYRSCLPHPYHSCYSLLFNGRVPLWFDDVNLVCFGKCEAKVELVVYHG